MFNKSKIPAPADQARPSAMPIPPLPDLPSPGLASRPVASAAVGSPAPATASRGLSTLSSDLQFEGNVSGGGDLQVDGSIKGDVRVGRLIVGETGAIEGSVTADYLEVRGRIVGAIFGKQVKLVGTAYVDGDITAEQLSIDVGAYFQGRCIQGRREAPAAVAPTPRPTAQPSTESASVTPPHGDDLTRIIDMKPAT